MVETHETFLRDFGTTVQRTGNADFRALVDVADAGVFATATATQRSLIYPASTTPPLAAGEVLVIAGGSYKLTREPARHIDDGAWMVAQVVPA